MGEEVGATNASILCRDSWFPVLPFPEYSQYTCVKCFVQVFQNIKLLGFNISNPLMLYHKVNQTAYAPDADSADSVVCRDYLSGEECGKWRQCCSDARTCCSQTQQEAISSRTGLNDTEFCPSTWDGVACWVDTPSGVTASQTCPDYFTADNVHWLNPQATRNCTSDGGWGINPKSHTEFSDYAQCFNTETNISVLKASLYIDFIGNGLSILFLLSAICLILGSRPLRLELSKKTGLRLHFNLFVSVLLMGIFTVAFHSVYFDAFTAAGSDGVTPVYHNNAVWCRILHAMTKYFKSTTYMAMFCEGLFLYKRISNVMRMGIRDAMMKYLLITWAIPAVLVLTYSIVRVSLQKNDKCWIDHGLSYIEFIIVIPNILSLVCNLMFLISIEWMLCTKMRSDTSDRRVEVLRHALRATLSLIPIFGLQFLFIIYRPQHWPPYEIIIACFTSTQGILVAILYCFATKEVRRELNAISRKCTDSRRDSLTPSLSSSTRSTRQSHLSTASTFLTSLSHRLSKSPDTNNTRRSLPDLVSSSDRRGSGSSRGSSSKGGDSNPRRDSGLSLGGGTDGTRTPERSRAPSETESLIGHGSGEGEGGGGGQVWERRRARSIDEVDGGPGMEPVLQVETSFTGDGLVRTSSTSLAPILE